MRIFSHLALERHLSMTRRGLFYIIFVKNVGKEIPKSISKKSALIMDVVFDDIDCKMPPFVMPEKDDVASVIDFYKKHSNHNIIFSCANGTTRSPSLAYVCECTKKHPSYAIEYMRHRDFHLNRVIVKYGAEILNEPEVYNYYEKYMFKKYEIKCTNQL